MANILFQWFSMALLSVVHPFFVSMTDVNYNAKDKNLEVSVRIFTDDFENILTTNYKTKVDLQKSSNQAEMGKLVNDYIQKHLHFQVDGKPVTLSYVGFEQQEESTWTYFEIEKIPSVKKIAVSNSLLHDYKKEQINMLHLKANGKEDSYKLDYPNTQAAFDF
jgi:hypothetical protein